MDIENKWQYFMNVAKGTFHISSSDYIFIFLISGRIVTGWKREDFNERE